MTPDPSNPNYPVYVLALMFPERRLFIWVQNNAYTAKGYWTATNLRSSLRWSPSRLYALSDDKFEPNCTPYDAVEQRNRKPKDPSPQSFTPGLVSLDLDPS